MPKSDREHIETISQKAKELENAIREATRFGLTTEITGFAEDSGTRGTYGNFMLTFYRRYQH